MSEKQKKCSPAICETFAKMSPEKPILIQDSVVFSRAYYDAGPPNPRKLEMGSSETKV